MSLGIGLEIRKIRKEKKLTIENVVDLLPCGWFPSKLAKIERGEQEATPDELHELMLALQVNRVTVFYINDMENPALQTV